MAEPTSTNGPGKRWQSMAARAAQGKRDSAGKGRQVFILLAALLALGGAIVALFLFLRPTPTPYFLTIAIREYKDRQWPVNPVAVQDSNALLPHFPADQRQEAFDCQTRTRFYDVLRNLPQDTGRPLVVHICAHALVQDNEVWLLAGDASPDNHDQWLSLTEVVELLQKNPTSNKLLILDVMRPVLEPRLGLLRNDVPAQVEKLLDEWEKQDKLPFFVLCACAADQSSLVLEEAQMSAFAFYLDRGLSGFADGASDDYKDGRVTVKELATYLNKQVDRWAKIHQHTRQTPKLFGQAGDFGLVVIKTDLEDSGTPTDKLAAYPPALKKAWELRDQWEAQDVFLLAPRPFRHLEFLLLRHEQQWRGGRDQKDVEKELADRLKEVTQLVDQAKKMVHPAPRSLPLALADLPTAEREKEEAEAKAALEELWIKLDSGEIKFDKAEDLAKAKPEFAKFWKKLEKLPPARGEQAVVEALANTAKLPLTKLRLAHELLHEKSAKPLYTETLLLQRLDNLRKDKIDGKGWDWPEFAAVQVLRATREGEAAIAALKAVPQALPWISGQFQKADEKRREGERLLFTGHHTSWDRALTLLQQAEQSFRKIQNNVRAIQQARHDAGLALLVLPGYVPALAPALRDLDRTTWTNAVQETIALVEMLENPAPEQIEQIKVTRLNLAVQLIQLKKIIGDRLEELSDPRNVSGKTYSSMRTLLASPRLSAAQRLKLSSTARQLSVKLHGEALEHEQPADGVPLKRIPAVEKKEVSELAWQQAAWRASFSVELLKLAGMRAADVEASLTKAQNSRIHSDWLTLGQHLREQWTAKLPGTFYQGKENLPLATRLSYLVAPYETESTWHKDQASWSQNPASLLHQEQYKHFWHWLGQRCRDDHQQLAKELPGVTFFADAAEEYSR